MGGLIQGLDRIMFVVYTYTYMKTNIHSLTRIATVLTGIVAASGGLLAATPAFASAGNIPAYNGVNQVCSSRMDPNCIVEEQNYALNSALPYQNYYQSYTLNGYNTRNQANYNTNYYGSNAYNNYNYGNYNTGYNYNNYNTGYSNSSNCNYQYSPTQYNYTSANSYQYQYSYTYQCPATSNSYSYINSNYSNSNYNNNLYYGTYPSSYSYGY